MIKTGNGCLYLTFKYAILASIAFKEFKKNFNLAETRHRGLWIMSWIIRFATVLNQGIILVSPVKLLSDRNQTVKFWDWPTTIFEPYAILANNDFTLQHLIDQKWADAYAIWRHEQKSFDGPRMTVHRDVLSNELDLAVCLLISKAVT